MKTVQGTLLILSLIAGMSFSAFAGGTLGGSEDGAEPDQSMSKEATKRRVDVRRKAADADRAKAQQYRKSRESGKTDSSGQKGDQIKESDSNSKSGLGQQAECHDCGAIADGNSKVSSSASKVGTNHEATEATSKKAH